MPSHQPTILSPLSYPVILTTPPAIFLFGLIWKRSDVLARSCGIDGRLLTHALQ
jgi:hypothetical protein